MKEPKCEGCDCNCEMLYKNDRVGFWQWLGMAVAICWESLRGISPFSGKKP